MCMKSGDSGWRGRETIVLIIVVWEFMSREDQRSSEIGVFTFWHTVMKYIQTRLVYSFDNSSVITVGLAGP
jgi:hypothetical protein